MHFTMSSAIRFSLDQSKILSYGNGLNNEVNKSKDVNCVTADRRFYPQTFEK